MAGGSRPRKTIRQPTRGRWCAFRQGHFRGARDFAAALARAYPHEDECARLSWAAVQSFNHTGYVLLSQQARESGSLKAVDVADLLPAHLDHNRVLVMLVSRLWLENRRFVDRYPSLLRVIAVAGHLKQK